MFRAAGLRCEHREDSPCVDAARPRLGWVLEADGRDRRQTGYRILVALSDDDLAAERGTLWDSGPVSSSRSFDVPYAGRPLPPASEVVWTVQVLDETGAASEWASPARFRTALDGWAGEWIARDRAEDPGVAVEWPPESEPDEMLRVLRPVPYLRREFSLAGPVRRATLYATARGVLELELNGARVGDAVLAPGWTDYGKRIEYAVHDVTDLLREGANAIGAILGEGWYAGHVGFESTQRARWYGRDAELLCELRVEYVHGGAEVVASDGRWRASVDGPIRYSDLLHGERYDARMELTGWSQPGFDDGGWGPVVARPLDALRVVPERSQPVRVTEELRPVAVWERAPGVHVFDLGQNMVGRVRLRVEGEAGRRVELRFAEMLEEDGSLHLANLASARPVETYFLRGGGVETFEPRFTFHGFRYVEARGLPGTPGPETVTGRVVGSDLPVTGSFSCSSELVNRIQQNVVWGQRGNFLSIPTDCPQRDERLGWLCDAQVFLPTASLNMDVSAFMAKWGDDLIDGQSANGAYPDVAPRLVMLRDGAPAWADAGVIVPWTLYRRYGDLRLVERHWPHMERYMAYLHRHNPDLLWRRRRGHDYGDWLPAGEHVPKELLATAYWAWDAKLMAEMAAALGLRERAEAYERLRAGIAAAFNAAYVADDGSIEGDTQTGYLLALAFDLLPDGLRSAAADRLVANIERHGGHLTTGFVGVGLLCPVLTQMGRADVAHELLAQDTFPSWGYMVRQGATTMWERWDGWTEQAGFQDCSFNHYAFGAVGSWLIESVAGIRGDERAVAYGHVVVEPVPGQLTAARGSYRSVRGEIVSEWSRDEEGFTLAVVVPPNVTATVVVPAVGDSLAEGGTDAREAAGVRSVERGASAWTVEVGSGSYVFQAT